MLNFSVDGTDYQIEEGRTILQALDELGVLMNGVDVPHYCWHPKLAIDGSCRLCQVEIEGIPKLQIACNTPVQEGMAIHTQNERVRKAREGVMELLLINHPLDCPICDQAGECKLQDYAFEYGMTQSRSKEPRRALKKNVSLGPTITFDQERCILCRRCVRFCREVPETGELAVFARGDESVIETFPGTELDNDYSMNVADICPVGALTTKDFRFKIRVWFLEDVPGVCTGCSKGCNVHVGVANNKIYRYVPRRNDDVNETWICDEGRLSYKEIGGADRLRGARVRSASGALIDATFDNALAHGAERIQRLVAEKGAGVVAGVASPHATNEDLYSFRRFLEALQTESSGVAVRKGRSDEILIQEEKAANAAGARAIGFPDAASVVERIKGGGVDALVVMGHDLLDDAYLGDAELLANLDTVVLIDSTRSALADVAHVVLPARQAAEKHGTLTNHQRRVQRVRPAVEPAFEAYAEGETVHRLGRAMGLPGFDGAYDVVAASKELAERVPAFSGIDLVSVGDGGKVLAGGGET